MALAQSQQPGPRHVPAKVLAVPTDVSPEMQEIIARPLNPDWNDQWKTGEEARRYAYKQAAAVVKTIPGLLERMHVKMEASTMGSVLSQRRSCSCWLRIKLNSVALTPLALRHSQR